MLSIRRIMRRPRIRLGSLAGVRLFVNHKELLVAAACLLLLPGSGSEARLGRFLAYLLLIIVHELGHALVGRLCGWSTRAITFGVFSGLCEFRQDHCGASPASRLRADIFISWGGVLAQAVVLMCAVCIVAGGVWPESQVFVGLLAGLTWLNAAIIAWNLLPMDGYDGDIAWAWLRWQKNLVEYGDVS